MSSDPIIELKELSHTYVSKKEAKLAVKNINLKVDAGEFISFIGPSGCGKSTILSCIAGLILPTKGEVLINGRAIQKPSSKVGYMLQSDYLFEWRTIQENVLIGLEIMNSSTPEQEKYGNFLLNEMGLSEYKDHYPSQLSGGMRQRAALVRTLITNPDILLLDEPFSALDYQTKLRLEELVSETLKKHEKTACLVTHDIGEAISMSDRIFILSSNPGTVKEELIIPEKLRETAPIQVREQKEYHELFHYIWKELEVYES